MSSSEAVAKKFSQGPEWLRSLRVKCFEMYSSLPPEVSELYVRHYEAPSIDDQKLLENIDADDSRSIPQDFAHLTEDSAHPTAIFVGKHLAHIHLTEEVEKTGTLFLSWSEAVKRQESFLRDAYTRILNSPYVDKYAYLIHALTNTGVYIRIPEKTQLSRPFRIVYILDKPSEVVFSKVVVLGEKQSAASVIEEVHGLPEADGSILGHHTHVIALQDSNLKHSTLQNMSHSQIYLANRVADTGANSSIMVVGSVIGGAVSKIRVDSSMHGDGASVNDLEIAFGDDEQRIDVTANLHHIGFGTQGRVIAKGVVKDKAKSIFKGVITIEKPAKGTSAYLAEHAMIMSPEARAYAIPSLEIMTDEVKATHSASVSQIDPEQIYYLMARGIPEQEARKMLALGFFEPVVSMVDLDEVRWGLRSLLEGKWGGTVTELFEEPEVTVTSLFGTHYKYRYGK
ncbi:MAG: Fe-S cluster assembly protein SufD [Candidatus Caldarchaeum sp.]|nr:Fe-S cluster assembly protein SufD [Candidatus Caldarchaeum sp.]MDW8063110.1 Fe-S cluster assembly protein SufD [Candidatus Caldarchaeum sp.]MDW8435750.1 Fe-S cluster assembly protein SufD [Candidatus Caldarchaeum sp.]